ncbi:MAG: hypothetical protein LBC19_16425 [Tannerella sp.]|nr:hypothetical protein [Tannerella sp.]
MAERFREESAELRFLHERVRTKARSCAFFTNASGQKRGVALSSRTSPHKSAELRFLHERFRTKARSCAFFAEA